MVDSNTRQHRAEKEEPHVHARIQRDVTRLIAIKTRIETAGDRRGERGEDGGGGRRRGSKGDAK